jgi:hypothetical protein
LPLNFTVDEPTSWIGYSLDQQDNVTIAGNVTLTGLPDGAHQVKIYANDTVGNIGVSETINCTFAQETELKPSNQGSELSLAKLVGFTSGAVLCVIILGLLVYFKKLKAS